MAPDLLDIGSRLSGVTLLVVGDVMLDRYIYGSVSRISPEAPVPVLRHRRETEMLGGAGNVAANAAALGATVHLLGVVGRDEAAMAVRARLADGGRIRPHLLDRADGPTTLKTRLIAESQQIARLDREEMAPLDPDARAAMLATLDKLLPDVQALILSDYGKGVLADGMAAAIIARASAAGRPVIVDPKSMDFADYAGATVVTPNRGELARASGLPAETDAQVESACRALIARHRLGAIVATRSEQGMSVVEGDQATHIPTMAREVFDVSGAGDTAVATLACGLAAGAPLATAAALANAAAGVVVGKLGTAQVTWPELTAAMRQADRQGEERKIASGAEALARVAEWRATGLRVGFTNGCFDLLHPGHVSLLRQARAACDRLVVGLNTDASVRRLKGPTRPVQPESARATVLASLASVDLVVLFDEDTPLALIQALLPDVLVKGADYRVDQVVGADVVIAAGGRVMLADLEPGFSTTATVARMRSGSTSPSS